MNESSHVLPPDHRERALALDPCSSFIVQAPAGSGKTELLIQRILALLGGVEKPEEILAITFTRKAASEMRMRLAGALEAAARSAPPEKGHAQTTWTLARAALEQDRRHGWRLLENPARLQVQTIDGFCASLTRRMPWLSRFGGRPETADDPLPLYRQAAEGLLARLESGGGGSDEISSLLAHLDNRMELLRDLLVEMLGRRDQWLRHLLGAGERGDRQTLEGGFRSLAESALATASQGLSQDLREEILAMGRYAAENLGQDDPAAPLAPLRGLQAFPDAVAEDLPVWLGVVELLLTRNGDCRRTVNKSLGFPASKGGEAPEMKGRMLSLLERIGQDEECIRRLRGLRELPLLRYEDREWEVLQALIRLLPLAVIALQDVFRDSGKVDFVEVAGAAQAALGDDLAPEDLLLQLDSRINHILVDEFQDTSFGQYLLLRKLTSGWTDGDGRTLFVVGDPMQSIYRFREAEVGLYLRARREGLGSVRLQPLKLSANFRSQRGVVDWVNEAFPRLFPRAEDEALGAVPHASAVPIRDPLPGPAVTVTPFLGRDDGKEAEAVLSLIADAVRENPKGSIAVLVRSRSHLGEIVRVLKREGLRFQAQEIDLLADRPVAQDLLALTRAILHPADRVAWLAVLRAPWCGLSLEDLLTICEGDRSRSVLELLKEPSRLNWLSSEGKPRALRALKTLEKALEERGRVPLTELVGGCWLELGGPACVTPAGLDDARMVLDLLDDHDHGGNLVDFEALNEGLQNLFAAPETGSDIPLQLMTMHKAKGLEFDTVILPGLGKTTRQGGRSLLRWNEHPEHELLLAPIPAVGETAEGKTYQAIGTLLRQKDELEAVRLLYVAATRAKGRLHLLGHARLSREGEVQPAPGSLLASAWEVLAPDFSSTGEPLIDDEEIGPKPTPLLGRLPLSWALPEMESVPGPAPSRPLLPSETGDAAGHGRRSGFAMEEAKAVGTVTHQYLELIAAQGLGAWSRERILEERGTIQRRLNRLGIPGKRLEEYGSKILKALENSVSTPKGKWILAPHPGGACELALSGIVEGRIVHAVIDRTFLDEEGARWVIDYKTGEPTEEPLSDFLTREAETYRGQLSSYTALLRQLEPERAVRTALYFPLVDGWREVSGD